MKARRYRLQRKKTDREECAVGRAGRAAGCINGNRDVGVCVCCGVLNADEWRKDRDYNIFARHGTVTKVGMKTKYCIQPLRMARTGEEERVDITVNDECD